VTRCENFVAQEIAENLALANAVLQRGARQNLQSRVGGDLVSERRSANLDGFNDLLSKIGVTRESLAKSVTITRKCQL